MNKIRTIDKACNFGMIRDDPNSLVLFSSMKPLRTFDPDPMDPTGPTPARAPDAATAAPGGVAGPFPRHALVVGATGMLRRCCLHLASPPGGAWSVSAVARTAADLKTLVVDAGRPPPAERDDEAGATPPRRRGYITGMPLDYAQTQRLALGIRAAVTARGPIRLAIAWVHRTAPKALATIAQTIGHEDDPVHFFHIVGSATADPSRVEREVHEIASHPGILYRRVILGFIIEPRGSRWLNNDEIARGTIEAIRRDEPEFTIGTCSPWSARPGF